MGYKQNQEIRFDAFFTSNKIGKTGLTPVVYVWDPIGNMIVNEAATVEIGHGLYSYALSAFDTGTPGIYRAVFLTTNTTVDLRELAYSEQVDPFDQVFGSAVYVHAKATNGNSAQSFMVEISDGPLLNSSLVANYNAFVVRTKEQLDVADVGGGVVALNSGPISDVFPGDDIIFVAKNENAAFASAVWNYAGDGGRTLDGGGNYNIAFDVALAIGSTNYGSAVIGRFVVSGFFNSEQTAIGIGLTPLRFLNLARSEFLLVTSSGTVLPSIQEFDGFNVILNGPIGVDLVDGDFLYLVTVPTSYLQMQNVRETIWGHATERALTDGGNLAVAQKVETEIIDDTDSEKVLKAIVDKIASVNPSLEGLTLGAIASAVRTELGPELLALLSLREDLTTARVALLDNLGNPGGLTAEQSATLEAMAVTIARFDEVVPGTAPLSVVGALTPPYAHLVPVVLDVRKGGVPLKPGDVQVYYREFALDQPVNLENWSENVGVAFEFERTPDFVVLPGMWLLESSYLEGQGVSGEYYAFNNELNYSEETAKFKVPALVGGRTFYTLGELIKAGV